jgi:hypothetical protein
MPTDLPGAHVMAGGQGFRDNQRPANRHSRRAESSPLSADARSRVNATAWASRSPGESRKIPSERPAWWTAPRPGGCPKPKIVTGPLPAPAATGEPWWLVPLALLAPDLFMAGYLCGTRPRARLYNITYSTALPAGMVGLGWWQRQPLVLALGLIWLTHIGMDRLLGYGLKYDDHFQHTHLGIQATRDGSDAREEHWRLLASRR